MQMILPTLHNLIPNMLKHKQRASACQGNSAQEFREHFNNDIQRGFRNKEKSFLFFVSLAAMGPAPT